MIAIPIVAMYMFLACATTYIMARHFLWDGGYYGPGQIDSDEQVISVIVGLFWPISVPCLLPVFAINFAKREPRKIRAARKKKELEAFARSEGLTL